MVPGSTTKVFINGMPEDRYHWLAQRPAIPIVKLQELLGRSSTRILGDLAIRPDPDNDNMLVLCAKNGGAEVYGYIDLTNQTISWTQG